jgi:hypothetical protein
MKRLLPFDLTGNGCGMPPLRKKEFQQAAQAGDEAQPERQSVVTSKFDPRRTAFYAVVTAAEHDELRVSDAPVEILPYRGIGLVQTGRLRKPLNRNNVRVIITESTFFDLDREDIVPADGTPLIIVGMDVGGTIEAEIIASMDAEARYRPIVLKHQGSRDWHRPMSTR